MLYDAMTGKGNDCKHMANFTGAVLQACGYNNWCYRFAGYSKYINVPTHVYCYAKDDDGLIYIDAVINGFDLEKPFVLKIDKKINNKDMSLYKLSGFDNEISGLSDIWNKGKQKVKQASNFVKETADQAANKAKAAAKQAAEYTKKEAERVKNQVLQGAKTVSLKIPRNAFLLLLRFNVHGWATGLKNKTFGELGWWSDDWGGNRTDLLNAIKAGSKNKRILGFDYDDTIYPSMVGAIGEPVTIATALATATPIIIKITDILDKAQKAGEKAEGFKKAAEGLTKKADSIADTVRDAKNGFEKATGQKVEDILWKKDAGTTGSKNSLTAADLKETTPQDAQRVADALTGNKKGINLDTKTMLLIGGAGLALLLILKRK
jgi:hypothetical protein